MFPPILYTVIQAGAMNLINLTCWVFVAARLARGRLLTFSNRCRHSLTMDALGIGLAVFRNLGWVGLPPRSIVENQIAE